jgi:porphobilinogen synthase
MYLQKRPRILRSSASLRSLVAETSLSPNDFIAPLFIDEGENIKTAILCRAITATVWILQ